MTRKYVACPSIRNKAKIILLCRLRIYIRVNKIIIRGIRFLDIILLSNFLYYVNNYNVSELLVEEDLLTFVD